MSGSFVKKKITASTSTTAATALYGIHRFALPVLSPAAFFE